MSLSGKTYVIFGGTSGMGKAAAVGVVRRGATAWIVGRDAGRLESAKEEVATKGGNTERVKASSVDAASVEAVTAFFADIPAGSINGIINTQGPSVGCSSILGAENFAKLQEQFNAKFFSQVLPVSIGAEKIADGGRIVFTSGALAKRPGAGSTALATANASLDAIVKGLANDLGPRLLVNTVSPGLTRTEMWTNVGMSQEQIDGMMKGFGANVPAGRGGESEDVGEAINYLLEASWVTGTVLDVDGGAPIRK